MGEVDVMDAKINWLWLLLMVLAVVAFIVIGKWTGFITRGLLE